jgi:hypothetical protein
MQIVFDAKPIEAKPLKEITGERLRFALRRMAQQVSTARVSFTDVNGPRGGVDKQAKRPKRQSMKTLTLAQTDG